MPESKVIQNINTPIAVTVPKVPEPKHDQWKILLLYVLVEIALNLQEPFDFYYFNTLTQFNFGDVVIVYSISAIAISFALCMDASFSVNKSTIGLLLSICIFGTSLRHTNQYIGFMLSRPIFVGAAVALRRLMYRFIFLTVPSVSDIHLLLYRLICMLVATSYATYLVHFARMHFLMIYSISIIVIVFSMIVMLMFDFDPSADVGPKPTRDSGRECITESWILAVEIIVSFLWNPMSTSFQFPRTLEAGALYMFYSIMHIAGLSYEHLIMYYFPELTYSKRLLLLGSSTMVIGCSCLLASTYQVNNQWRELQIINGFCITYFGLGIAKSVIDNSLYQDDYNHDYRKSWVMRCCAVLIGSWWAIYLMNTSSTTYGDGDLARKFLSLIGSSIPVIYLISTMKVDYYPSLLWQRSFYLTEKQSNFFE